MKGKPSNQRPGTIKPAASTCPPEEANLAKATPRIVSVAAPLVVVEFKAMELGDIAQVMLVVLAGSVHDRLTVPVNPLVPPTVMADEPLAPTATVNAVGLALIVKSGKAHVMTVLPDLVPTVAVIVLVPVA